MLSPDHCPLQRTISNDLFKLPTSFNSDRVHHLPTRLQASTGVTEVSNADFCLVPIYPNGNNAGNAIIMISVLFQYFSAADDIVKVEVWDVVDRGGFCTTARQVEHLGRILAKS